MKRIKFTAEDLQDIIKKQAEVYATKSIIPTKLTFDTNPSIKADEKVKITFSQSADEKMQALIQECSKEIAWKGIVEKEGNKEFFIQDIIMFPQKVSSSTVETDDDLFSNWITEKVMNNEIDKIRFHGHSHVNMGVSPSTVDIAYQETILTDIKDFYIFGIFNKKEEWWFNVYDVESNILYEKDDIEYFYHQSPAKEWAKDSIEKYVKEQTYSYYDNYYGRNSKWNSTSKKKKDEKKDEKFDLRVKETYYDEFLGRTVLKGEPVLAVASEREAIWDELEGKGGNKSGKK